jgi:hypothetical protein
VCGAPVSPGLRAAAREKDGRWTRLSAEPVYFFILWGSAAFLVLAGFCLGAAGR